jgi:hypothetical protein
MEWSQALSIPPKLPKHESRSMKLMKKDEDEILMYQSCWLISSQLEEDGLT